MKKSAIFFAVLLTVLSTEILHSQTENLPPLLDRELFFGDPQITGGQLSPDGTMLSFLKPFRGTRNIWVKKLEDPFEKAQPLTAEISRPIRNYFWSRDSKFILYVQDKGGNENFQLYRVNPFEKPEKKSGVPTSVQLTKGENSRTIVYELPKKKPGVIYIGLNDRDPAWHDLYELNLSTGEKRLVFENNNRFSNWLFDLEGNLHLGVRSTEDGVTEFLKIDSTGFSKVYECGIFENCTPIRFHPDCKRFYLTTNKTERVNLSFLATLSLTTKAIEVVSSDPKNKVDFERAIFSNQTDELVGTVYADEKDTIYWKDKAWEQDFEFIKTKLPEKTINLISRTADDNFWLVNASSDTDPGAVYWFDRSKKALKFQYRSRPEIPIEYLATTKVVKYPSTDGLEISAYLTLPKGIAPKNLPLIIYPHGGPWERDHWGYNPHTQFLANRGYAVLQPNFRGSKGFGKKFLNAGNLEWGRKMQDDLTNGAKFLIEQGIADRERIGIYGTSYGGYAALAGLTFTPNLYSCGVSMVGPSNLFTLLKSIPQYWESFRKQMFARMGNPSDPIGKLILEDSSPLFSARNIKAPLLVVQGANDPRVKQAESDQIVIACRDLGLPVEYLVAKDEGHGFANPINNLAFFAVLEKFLAKHLGGRYQSSMRKEIKRRLHEMTVNIEELKINKTLEGYEITAPTPLPEVPLAKGVSKYVVGVEIGGKKMDLNITTEITDFNSTEYLAVESMTSQLGTMTDTTILDKATLLPKYRSVNQGAIKMNFSYSDSLISGFIGVPGLEGDTIFAKLKAALFAEGAASGQVLSCLPLKVGYATIFRNDDTQAKEIAYKELRVVGKEKVTVQAGTYDCYKLEISTKGQSDALKNLWISDDKLRKVVKTRAVLPQANGAELIGELVQ